MVRAMTDVMHHTLYDGRRIAFHFTPGAGPTLVFLPGYMSDMSGSKATALFAEAQAQGRACLLLDYSGCGASGGDFSDGMLSRWRDEVLALVASYVSGPVLLVGDAASTIDPLSSQGLAKALASADAGACAVQTMLERPDLRGLVLQHQQQWE